mmetsp:Transcript_10295/g.31990  ORF Transcript_10295/g.31990 Transcript_10295/m.31990 type:complete len:243 (-) Transcript_10295:424-1152(-)
MTSRLSQVTNLHTPGLCKRRNTKALALSCLRNASTQSAKPGESNTSRAKAAPRASMRNSPSHASIPLHRQQRITQSSMPGSLHRRATMVASAWHSANTNSAARAGQVPPRTSASSRAVGECRKSRARLRVSAVKRNVRKKAPRPWLPTRDSTCRGVSGSQQALAKVAWCRSNALTARAAHRLRRKVSRASLAHGCRKTAMRKPWVKTGVSAQGMPGHLRSRVTAQAVAGRLSNATLSSDSSW